MRIPIFIIALLPLAAAASAADGSGAKRLETIYSRNGIEEGSLHANVPPDPAQLGGMDRAKDLRAYLPACKRGQVAGLPPEYDKQYALGDKEEGLINRTAASLRKYENIGTALADGFLPAEGYETGMGLGFAHPNRMPAAKVNWSSPSILFYVKQKEKPVYRLVSAAYLVSGDQPSAVFQVSKKDKRAILKQWRPWNKLCWWRVKGLFVYEDEEDADSECGGGHYMETGWVLHLKLPLVNPLGMFTPRNPAVDYLDASAREFPFCHD